MKFTILQQKTYQSPLDAIGSQSQDSFVNVQWKHKPRRITQAIRFLLRGKPIKCHDYAKRFICTIITSKDRI